MGQQLTGASPAAMLEVFAKFKPAQLSSRYLQWQNGHLQVARKDSTGIPMSKCTTGRFWNTWSSLVGCHILHRKLNQNSSTRTVPRCSSKRHRPSLLRDLQMADTLGTTRSSQTL